MHPMLKKLMIRMKMIMCWYNKLCLLLWLILCKISRICSHDTPSRMPLIWRESQPASPSAEDNSSINHSSSPTVPAIIVLLFFILYVGVGAFTFASTSGWSFLDATYFCFIALSTIGVGDKLPNNNADTNGQMQIFACCLYLVFGLVIVAMCFTLVHEELTLKCKKFANDIGFLRH